MKNKLVKNVVLLLLASLSLVFFNSCTKEASGPTYEAGGDALAPDISNPSVEETLAKEAGIQRIVFHVGPVDLTRGQDVQTMQKRPITMRFQMDKPVWVTGFSPKIVDANGKELPSELLHEATIFNMHEENPLCAGSPNPFVIANSMLTNVELPKGYGYPVLQSDPLEVKVILKNTTSMDYIDVYFELTLVTRQISDMVNLKDVKPMLVELDTCEHKAIDVEPNNFVERTADYTLETGGNIIAMHGILQEFGASLSIFQNDSITPFWRTDAILNEDHLVQELTDNPMIDEKGIAVKEGDKLTLEASYDNTSDNWLIGSTASAMIYMAPR